jgi:hypothetical protein
LFVFALSPCCHARSRGFRFRLVVRNGPVNVRLLVRGTVLALDAADAAVRLPDLAPGWSVVVARFALLDDALLRRVAPDVVAFPLFGPGYDALQVVERLGQLGYRGRMCCITDPLPAPEMVRCELEAAGGGGHLVMVERRVSARPS